MRAILWRNRGWASIADRLDEVPRVANRHEVTRAFLIRGFSGNMAVYRRRLKLSVPAGRLLVASMRRLDRLILDHEAVSTFLAETLSTRPPGPQSRRLRW